MKVLITGNRGYLGRHLVKKNYEKKLDWDIHISNTTDNNLMSYDKWGSKHIFFHKKFDIIFHLASKTKAGDYCLYHQGEQWIDNQQINTNILRLWKEHQPQARMIAMGTSCSYDPNMIMSEENYMKGIPEKSLYTYANTKRMLLVGLKAMYEQYNMKFHYLIPSTLYGPGFDKEDSHFIFDLIKKIHLASKSKKRIDLIPILWGDGYQKRELVYIDDVVDVMLHIARNCSDVSDHNIISNIGSGVDHTIREYAKMVSLILQYDHEKIRYDNTKYVGVQSKRLETRKIRSIISDYNKNLTTIDLGLIKTIKYYKENLT